MTDESISDSKPARNADPPESDEPVRHSRFVGFHARTYEMELLVSGAVVFGLVQLPGVIDRAATSLLAGLEGHSRTIGTLGYAYIDLALYGLIAVFIIHLVLRGFWIGLLGLESVFPEGIRWEHLKVGPTTKRKLRKQVGSLAEIIDTMDDRCSLVFSFGFLVIVIWLYFVVLVAVIAGLSVLISALLFDGLHRPLLFWLIMGIVVVHQAISDVVDRRLRPHFKSGGMIDRLFDGFVGTAYALSPMRLVGGIQVTLGSNLAQGRVASWMVACMLGVAVLHLSGTFVNQKLVHFDSLAYFPDSLRGQGRDPSHYRSLRDPDAIESLAPSIQSDIVTGPFLEVFLPYSPRRHNRLVAEACPDLEPLSSTGLTIGRGEQPEDKRVFEAARCLGSLFPIALDGRPVADPAFDFTIEGRSGIEGLVTYLPVRGLDEGRHVLTVLTPSRQQQRSDDPDAEPTRHVIPFWTAN